LAKLDTPTAPAEEAVVQTWAELLHLARSVDAETLCSEGQFRSISGDSLHEVTVALRAALIGTSHTLPPQSGEGNLADQTAEGTAESSAVESGATLSAAGTGETLHITVPMASPCSGSGAMSPEEGVADALVPVAGQDDEQEPELQTERTQCSWPSIHFRDDFSEASLLGRTPQEQPTLPKSVQPTGSSTLHPHEPSLLEAPRVVRTETILPTSTGWSAGDDEATALLKMEDAARRMLQSPNSGRTVNGHRVLGRGLRADAEVNGRSEAANHLPNGKTSQTPLLQESIHTTTNKRGLFALLLCDVCVQEPPAVESAQPSARLPVGSRQRQCSEGGNDSAVMLERR